MFGYDWPRFHAAVNDLPAALLFVTVLFDLGAWVTKRDSLKAAALWTLWAGVIGGWVAVLGSQSVINQDDRARAGVGQPAPERVELVQRAEDPAAAVVVDDDAAGRPSGNEDAQADLGVTGGGDLDVLDLRHRRACAVALDHLRSGGPGVGRAQLV